jgi:predicted GTPase
MARTRVVIMGAAGRDFHDFNTAYRDDPDYEVVAFTAATQIPGIAGRNYPPELAGKLYPAGIPIFAEAELERVIADKHADLVVFAYSDVAHEHVMHTASRALACGADFELLGPARTMIPSTKPVLATGATRTGAGKSQTTRYLAALLEKEGLKVVVVRHPMPYGDLVAQRVQRYAEYADLDRYDTTIEEREEYEPHLDAGRVLYAGVDYEAILRQAEQEADVVLWEGGNNDFPFYKPDLFIVIADPLRPGHELRYHPGETNVRMADAIIVNKIDSATPEQIAEVKASIAMLNPGAKVILARSALTLGADIKGKRVAVVEDGPTLTHGGMTFGAGVVAANRLGAAELVDPIPYATGQLAETLRKYHGLQHLLPAMGYGPVQMHELESALNSMPADVVLSATPIDLTRILKLDKPVVRVRYELEELSGAEAAGQPTLTALLAPVVEKARAARSGAARPAAGAGIDR